MEVDLRDMLTHLILFEKDKKTDELRQLLLEEFETAWGQMLVERTRNLTIKNLFSKAWKRVEGRLRSPTPPPQPWTNWPLFTGGSSFSECF